MDEIKWKLKHTESGEIIEISKSVFKVGRHLQADLKSQHVVVSRNHATLSVLIDGLLYVTDKSSNGTYINNLKIPSNEMRNLKHGDIVGFGCCQRVDTTVPLIYEVQSAESEKVEVNEVETVNKANKPTKEMIPNYVKKNEPVAEKDDFSFSVTDNDCIVISDGEDDEKDSACSQIFQISEHIKKEQQSFCEEVDPYCEIKRELEDLDYCETANVVPVDLTDEVTRFDSVTDLIDVLEFSSVENRVGSSSVDEVDENRVSSASIAKLEENHVAPSSIDKVADVPSTAECSVKKRTNSFPHKKLVIVLESAEKALSSKSKNKKSPFVEPYVNNKRSSTKFPTKTQEVNVKRKSLPKTNHSESSKKFKPNINDKNKCETNRQMKQEIAQERKKKLKELAEKKSNKDGTNAYKNTKGLAKVKTSDSSGKLVLEPTSGMPVSKLRFDKLQTQQMSKKTDEIQDTTISSNYSPNSYSVANPLLEPANVINKTGQNQRPDSTVNEDRSSLIWNMPLSRHAPQMSHVSRTIENMDEEIGVMVCWSVKWLMEQLNSDISPPVNGDVQLVRVPPYFNNFAEYLHVMSPLVMLELWQYIYQTAFNRDEERQPVRVKLVHGRKINRMFYLDCQCYFSEQEARNNSIFRPNDFTLIELKVKDSANCYQYTGFGHIKQVNKTNTKEGCCIDFTLAMRNLDKQIGGDQILVKVIGNISMSLRLLKTVKYLEQSPICQLVLNPNIIDYRWLERNREVNTGGTLNYEQKKIVTEATRVCLQDKPVLYLIKGPPGTGKSTVIVNIIMETIFKGSKILLTAPSNAAVDGLILKLNEMRQKLPDTERRRIKIIRIGPDSSISRNVDKYKLSTLARNNVLVNRGLVSMEEYKQCLEKGVDVDIFLRRHLGQKYFFEIKAAEDNLIFGANVICTTLNSCVSYRILQAVRRNQLKFSCCIIDEATQCNEVESLLPIQLGIDKFILVGDPKQLPAVICNKDAQSLGYGRSLFSRIDENFHNLNTPIRMLREQYRMKPEICEYPNKTFYNGQLKSSPRHRNLIKPTLKPYLLFNLTRTEAQNCSDYINLDEIALICNLLNTLEKCVDSRCIYTIGIITPYRAQKDMVTKHISGIRFNPNVSITVNTVDSFQGMENDIIIISCVRYSSNYFLQNEQRLNVALTRARQVLYVIGNYTLFKHCRPLYDLREDAKNRKLCLDIKDNPRNIPSFHKYLVK